MPWRCPPASPRCGSGMMLLPFGLMENTSWRPSIGTSTHKTPSIQFTMERELEGRVTSFDDQLERRGTTALTSIFRKRHTLTGTWTSTHITLPRYSEESCSAWRSEQRTHAMRESDCWRSNTSDNCSGPMAISWTCSEEEPERQTNTNQHRHSMQDTLKLLLLPYVRGFSEQIEKMCRPLGVRTVMKSTSTLRSSIVKVKQARPDMKEEGCCRARVPMCVYWRHRKNLGETSNWAQDSSEEWRHEQHCSSCLGEPALG